jgi:DNA-directed RNA polymerase sigma subunit (sigma70/sigma32)
MTSDNYLKPDDVPATRSKRREDILRRLAAGQTYEEISCHYGLARARIRQIAQQEGGDIRDQSSTKQ